MDDVRYLKIYVDYTCTVENEEQSHLRQLLPCAPRPRRNPHGPLLGPEEGCSRSMRPTPNSPESDLFILSKLLFCLDFCKYQYVPAF